MTWWALQIRSKSCLWRNLATTSAPKVKETPRSFSPQPSTSLSGSDHSRSHSRPWSGTSVGLMMRRICSMDCRSGDKPSVHKKKRWHAYSGKLHPQNIFVQHLKWTEFLFIFTVFYKNIYSNLCVWTCKVRRGFSDYMLRHSSPAT